MHVKSVKQYIYKYIHTKNQEQLNSNFTQEICMLNKHIDQMQIA